MGLPPCCWGYLASGSAAGGMVRLPLPCEKGRLRLGSRVRFPPFCRWNRSLFSWLGEGLGGIRRPGGSLQGRFVRYVSTRGEAPPLGFVEVMLAGLARDGGLYVPESWPRLSEASIAGFAGRPYAEVAVEVIRPFVGDAIPEADL